MIVHKALDFLAFFGMDKVPFSQGLPPDKLYMSPSFSDALARLGFVVSNNQFAVLSGPPGCGKSTALRAFASTLNPDQYRCLYISESNLTPRWLYSVLLRELGIELRYFANDVKRQLHEALMTESRVKHKRIVMIIDEAHLINGHHKIETLEEIRFLLNCNFDSENPLTLILCGQNELWELLNGEPAQAIAQRIDVIARLDPMSQTDVSRYIDAHLRYSGTSEDIFSAQAVSEIYNSSGGIARVINKICLHSLLIAVSEQTKNITEKIVKQAVTTELPKAIIRH